MNNLPSMPVRVRRGTQLALPLVALAAFLAWGWHRVSLTHGLPNYGDTLEVTWAVSWIQDALRTGQSPAVYPLAFYPGGWPIATFATGYLLMAALLPLNLIGGPAFAYNVAALLSFALAFLGAYQLARVFVDRLGATLAGLLIAFWSLSWFQASGHLNILLASSLLPWMLWTVERGIGAQGKSLVWYVLTGLLWAVAIVSSVYFIWIGGLAIGVWLLGRWLARALSAKKAWAALAVCAAAGLVLSAPALVTSWQATRQVGGSFAAVDEVNFWGASLNSLPIPSLNHPWLGSLARQIYQGLPYEQALANLGIAALVVAAVGWLAVRRDKAWLPVVLLAVTGVVLALGLTLKWDNQSIQAAWLRPVNQLLWQAGHALKPGFFTTPQPTTPFDTAIPLPGLLLAIFVPLIERARVFARYAFLASIGIYLLSARGTMQVRNGWGRAALTALLLVEMLPDPLSNVDFPTPPHPAFEWLSAQSLPGQSVVDLVAGHPSTPVLYNGGETVWATRMHGQPAVGGASSIWPAYTRFLFEWLATHQHSFWNLDTVPLLRFYGARYLLLHMRSELETEILQEARQNPELRLVDCFPGVSGPWNYPICVLEVLPSANPKLNLVPVSGWSGQEDWGVWAEGQESRALWVATAKRDHRLHVEAFPICLDAPHRTITLEVDGVAVAAHEWVGCEPWSEEIVVPADLVRLGGNELTMRSSHAARPSDVSATPSDDTRLLSAGFTRLAIE